MSALSFRGRTAFAVCRKVSIKKSYIAPSFGSLKNIIPNKLLEVSTNMESVIQSLHSDRSLITYVGVLLPESVTAITAFQTHPSNKLFSSSTSYFTGQNTEEKLSNVEKNSTDATELSSAHLRQDPSKGYSGPYRTADTQNKFQESSSRVDKELHSLNLNVQRTGRAYLDNVERILNTMKICGGCTSNEALLLLRCCGSFLTDEKLKLRADISEKVWEFFKNNKIQLDISHYNALLKNRLENEGPEYQPAEFLAAMEESGIEANRVTFQHLIAKFCSLGDIQGATTILEHMKEQKMSVNENIFHSLIIGHCRADDFQNAKGVMEIMVDSGVDVGNDTRMIYVLELARAGKDFRNELNKAITEGIQLTDNDLFKLIVLLLVKGEKEAANDIAEMLPKKRGFFQEMRNFIPSMISTGELELPFKILEQFRAPIPIGSEGHADSSLADHGLFFVNAMVKNEYDPKSLIQYAKKFEGSESMVCNRILETSVEQGNIQYGQSLYDEIINEFGKDILNPAHLANFVRSYSNRIKSQNMDRSSTSEAFIKFLIDMGAIGLRPLSSDLSQSIIPNIMRGQNILPGQAMKRIWKKLNVLSDEGIQNRNPVPWYQLSNAMIQYLLNQENVLNFGNTIKFMISMNMPKRPHLWNSSLARSFLATDSKDSLITMLVMCSTTVTKQVLKNNTSNEEQWARNDVDLFQTLNHIAALAPRYRPNCKLEDILLPVLKDLEDLKIGVPEKVTSMLQRNVEGCSKEFAETLTQLESMYTGGHDSWTETATKTFLEDRTKLTNLMISMSQPDYVPMSGSGFIDKDNIPTDIKGLEKAQKIIDQKNLYNSTVSNLLISAYAEQDKLKEADSRIESIRMGDIVPNTAHQYVNACIRSETLDNARKFLEMITTKSDTKVWTQTYLNLGKALAEQGKHEKVLELFSSVDANKLESKKSLSIHASQIVIYYSNKTEHDNAENVFKVLQDANVITDPKVIKGLEASLGRGLATDANLDEKVSEFESIAKDEERLLQPFQLLKKLIAKEDTKGMQRVLDASIDVIGEARSLYNLAFTFIDVEKLSQAKKLLATPGLRYDHGKIKWIMDKFSETNKLDNLENFVKFCRPVFACNREFMYSSLISACAKQNDCNRIEEAWINMQEEDLTPSDALKLQISKALQAEGRPVPFIIPDTEQEEKHELTPDRDVSISTESHNENRIQEKNYSQYQTLECALNQNDVDTVMNCYKSMDKKTRSKIGLNVTNFILNVKDEQQQFEILQILFEDRAFNELALKYGYQLSSILESLNVTQLESIQNKLSKCESKLRNRYAWVYGKVHKLQISSDTQGYIRSLETNDTGRNSPSHRLIRQIIESSPNNAEQFFNCVLKQTETNPKLAIETIKYCLITKENADMVEKIWKMVEGQDLTREMFRDMNLKNCSNQELFPVKEFYLSCIGSPSISDVTRNSLKQVLPVIYNRLVSNAVNEKSKTGEEQIFLQHEPQDIIKEALSKWIDLDW